MPVKVIIRADGNSVIGFGHIIRTQALACQLEKCGAKVSFLTRNPENVAGFTAIKIPDDYNAEQEDTCIVQVAEELSAGMLIIDSYAFNQERLNKMAGLGLISVYVDDMNLYEFNTTYVINGNLYAPRLDYRGQARFLLGSGYLLMREQFTSILPRVVRPQVKNILLTFGAADPNNLTAMLLRQIKSFPRFLALQWHVIVGPAFRHISDLETLALDCSNILLHYNPDVKNLMEFCDISISAAGSTTYELAACGLPSIIIAAADNQLMLAEEADHQGISINLGGPGQIDYRDLERILNRLLDDFDLRKSMAELGQKSVDGQGAIRTAQTLLGADRF
ncbi:MAG: UDP-2,4-diacetamido-2,4,6-trideoxy-beta-L-altropyranose hydrolase [Syntrophomonadaceae bacterium]|nr:UDP-2,4-diacetamido-2,4,6-trideoxy-beta-L-altropyranose hydrolase [Syntrophomonadaceae bacterium]